MNRPLKNFLDVLLCIAIFAVVQIFIQLAVAGIYSFVKEVDFTTVSDGLTAGKYSDLIVVSSVLSSLVTLLIFTFGKFAVISRNYLASHPWARSHGWHCYHWASSCPPNGFMSGCR